MSSQSITAPLPAVAPTASHDLFALTDEQILDIQPDPSGSSSVAQPFVPALRDEGAVRDVNAATNSTAPGSTDATPPGLSSPTGHGSQITDHASPTDPPPWLAQQMNDPWRGDEARELWDGVVQARNEAATYRAAIGTPEQARATADRARTLEEIDSAFFGGAGKSAQEISAGRDALAQRMLREDPAAFREMVFAGLRALEAAPVGARHAVPAAVPAATPAMEEAQHTQLAAYRSFEKSANEDLERSVGAAIRHSLDQALPVAQASLHPLASSARGILPVHSDPTQARLPALHDHLAVAVRDDVESALKSDQQLGEQLSRLLSARRFDEPTRLQVVRLINDRAQQLVPVAARRVIQQWTQTAFAAHRGKGGDAAHGMDASAAQPRSLADTAAAPRHAGAHDASRSPASRAAAPATSAKAAAADRAERAVGLSPHTTARPNGRAVDYSRLTDEQILDL